MQKPRGRAPQKNHQEVIFSNQTSHHCACQPDAIRLCSKATRAARDALTYAGLGEIHTGDGMGMSSGACGEAETFLLNLWVTRVETREAGTGLLRQ